MLVHLALQTDCRLVPINIYRCLPLFRVSNSCGAEANRRVGRKRVFSPIFTLHLDLRLGIDLILGRDRFKSFRDLQGRVTQSANPGHQEGDAY